MGFKKNMEKSYYNPQKGTNESFQAMILNHCLPAPPHLLLDAALASPDGRWAGRRKPPPQRKSQNSWAIYKKTSGVAPG